MADFSWVEPSMKNLGNMLGLDPEAKAKGAALQQQREQSAAATDLTRAKLGLVPKQGAEIDARTAGYKEKTRGEKDKNDANGRLAEAIAAATFVDENGDVQVDPNGIAGIVKEFPHVKVDLEKFGKGLAELRLQSKKRGGGNGSGLPQPDASKKIVGPPPGEIMDAPAPVPGQPIQLSGGMPDLTLYSSIMGGAPSDLETSLRQNQINSIKAGIDAPANGATQPAPDGVAGMLSGRAKNDIPDAQLQRRLAQTGKVLSINQAVSPEQAADVRTQNTDNTIRVNAAKPVTLGAGQQSFNQQGEKLAENTLPRTLAGGASMVDKDGNVVTTAPKVGGKGSKGTGSGGEYGDPTTLDVNRSNEWIARAKEVVSEWAGSTSGNPISPGVASQLAAHAYQMEFGEGMPTKNADAVMRSYLAKSGYKFDNTVGNWNPFNSNKTEVYTQDGKNVTGGSDSPVQPIVPALQGGDVQRGKVNGTSLKVNPKDPRMGLMPSPDGSSPDKPHVLGVAGYPSDPADARILPGTIFAAFNSEDNKYYLYQKQPDGRNVTIDDATSRGQIGLHMADLQEAGFTVFGKDMPKDKRFRVNGVEKSYKPYEAVDVRHLLAPGLGLRISEMGWVNRIASFSEFDKMLRYIAKTETGEENEWRALNASQTVKAYYVEKDPDKKMDILQNWLNKRVAPVREFAQKEEEARAAQKTATLASTLSDTK